MLTPITCPACNVILKTPDKLLGKTILCPKCNQRVKLRAPVQAEEIVDDLEPIEDIAAFDEPEQAIESGEADELIDELVEEMLEETAEANEEVIEDAEVEEDPEG